MLVAYPTLSSVMIMIREWTSFHYRTWKSIIIPSGHFSNTRWYQTFLQLTNLRHGAQAIKQAIVGRIDAGSAAPEHKLWHSTELQDMYHLLCVFCPYLFPAKNKYWWDLGRWFHQCKHEDLGLNPKHPRQSQMWQHTYRTLLLELNGDRLILITHWPARPANQWALSSVSVSVLKKVERDRGKHSVLTSDLHMQAWKHACDMHTHARIHKRTNI